MLVSKVDHVFVHVDDADAAFALLHDELGLPVAWNRQQAFGSLVTMGVSGGNANIEVLASSDGSMPAARPHRVAGIAFEPAAPVDDAFLAEADRRGVAHGPVVPSTSSTGRSWKNVMFPGLFGDTWVFVCDYDDPAMHDAAGRQAVLDDAGGGRLGLVGVDEIVLGVSDMGAAADRWSTLLGPAAVAPGDGSRRWQVGVGPALRLVPADADAVVELVLRVRDVNDAQRVWDAADRASLGELAVRFV